MTENRPPADPTSTYRLQIHGGFTYDDARGLVPYLTDLGVSHIFCSPILQAAPGSVHGYDVVDHSRINAEAGGEDAFRAFSRAAHDAGLGVVVDVVPNHMAVPSPLWHNRALWSVLRDGPESPYATWFDIDLSTERAMLMPVLGDRVGAVMMRGELSVDEIEVPGPEGAVTEQVLRYYDHVFPIAAGTGSLPMADLLDRQWYRLAHWKVAGDELNYRRFFDVDTLAAVRVEKPEVFAATHELLLRLYREGLIDGFRIDHPDGLADPRGYLRELAEATDGAWVVAEKILEGDEQLPGDFPCAGTTGYDALSRIGGLFHDGSAAGPLTDQWRLVSGDHESFEEVVEDAKRLVLRHSLFAELDRLTELVHEICQDDIRLRDHTRRQIGTVLVELLVAMDRYRAYVVPGESAPASERAVVQGAAERASVHLGEDEQDTLALIVSLLCGDEIGSAGQTDSAARGEFIIRFAQTCGPVMAKAKEDTAFYRWHRFDACNEVGADPATISVPADDFHDFCRRQRITHPATMTTLSTHDTKRSEDVRSRLAPITELPDDWAHLVRDLQAATSADRPALLDGATEYLIWQTLTALWTLPGTVAGAAPISEERLAEYLTKAMREAKTHTTWTEQNPEYEDAVLSFARSCLDSDAVDDLLRSWTRRTATGVRAAVLGQKLVQLTMPGVPDIYQGNEVVDLSLVDPDNRRPVDFARRRESLDRLASGMRPDGLDEEKLLVVSRALQVRREHPDAFRGRDARYLPLATTTGHAVAFARAVAEPGTATTALPVVDPDRPPPPPASQPTGPAGHGPYIVTVATRLPHTLERRGGWADHTLVLPERTFTDALTGRTVEGGPIRLADLLTDLPVALLVGA